MFSHVRPALVKFTTVNKNENVPTKICREAEVLLLLAKKKIVAKNSPVSFFLILTY